MLKIETSLDWQRVQTEITKLGNQLSMFKHDIHKLSKTVQEEVTELSKLEVEHRSRRSKQTARACQEQVQKINETLKLFQKFHLMALLAQ